MLYSYILGTIIGDGSVNPTNDAKEILPQNTGTSRSRKNIVLSYLFVFLVALCLKQ